MEGKWVVPPAAYNNPEQWTIEWIVQKVCNCPGNAECDILRNHIASRSDMLMGRELLGAERAAARKRMYLRKLPWMQVFADFEEYQWSFDKPIVGTYPNPNPPVEPYGPGRVFQFNLMTDAQVRHLNVYDGTSADFRRHAASITGTLDDCPLCLVSDWD